jgi:phytoene desaturase
MAEDVELLPVMPFYRLNWPDGTTFDYSNDQASLQREIARSRPKTCPATPSSSNIRPRSTGRLRPAGHVSVPRLRLDAPRRARADAAPGLAVGLFDGSSFVKNEKLREAFSFHTLLVGGNPLTTSAIYALIHKLEMEGGVWCAKGGTNRLIAGMVAQFERLGGTLRLHDPVLHIHTLGDRATEVETVSGWRERFDAVASNADIMHTYRDLLSDTTRGAADGAQAGAQALLAQPVRRPFRARRQLAGIPHHNDPVRPTLQGAARGHLRPGVLPQDLSIYLHHPTVTDSVAGAAGQEHVLRAHPRGASGQAADRLGPGRSADRAAHIGRGRPPADPPTSTTGS